VRFNTAVEARGLVGRDEHLGRERRDHPGIVGVHERLLADAEAAHVHGRANAQEARSRVRGAGRATGRRVGSGSVRRRERSREGVGRRRAGISAHAAATRTGRTERRRWPNFATAAESLWYTTRSTEPAGIAFARMVRMTETYRSL
jgi:hypothetical protein